MKYKILITGGVGFIGSRTANKLESQGHKVRVLDNLNRQVHSDPKKSIAILNENIEFICGDVRDSTTVKDALDDIDVVYHLAAETGVGQSMYEQERYIDVNIKGTAVLCDCIIRNKIRLKKLILSSSRAVYGEGPYECVKCGNIYPKTRTLSQLRSGDWNLKCPKCNGQISPLPCFESAPRRPVSIYGYTKMVQEDLLDSLNSITGIPIVILRYFNVFGEGQSTSNPYTGVINIFATKMINNDKVEIWEDGQMLRDFISIYQVIDANLNALTNNLLEPIIFNIGSGNPISILEFANLLRKKLNYHKDFLFSRRFRFGDVRHCFTDLRNTKKHLLSIKNDQNNLEQTIDMLLKWVESNSNNVNLSKSLKELENYNLTDISR